MMRITRSFWIAALVLMSSFANAGTHQLFNGKDLTGWQHVGDGKFIVENGALRAQGGVGLLWFEGRKIGNAVLRVVYRVESSSDNSGIFIRIPEPPMNQWIPVDTALEVQINDAAASAYRRTGAIYTFSMAKSHPNVVGEWNSMEITIDGPRTAVHINGVLVSDYTEGDAVPPMEHDWDPKRGARPDSGYIAVQNHPHGKTVYFKEISIRSIAR